MPNPVAMGDDTANHNHARFSGEVLLEPVAFLPAWWQYEPGYSGMSFMQQASKMKMKEKT